MKIFAKQDKVKQNTANVDQLATIWAIVEARQTVPALLAVASATHTDDTEPIARGLARAAQDAGKRTGYLYLGPSRCTPNEHTFAYADLLIAGRQSQRESFDASLTLWRTAYDVIIVELPQLPSCELGAHVARLADGIVIALYPGRRVSLADRDLKALFSQLRASIIGIVKTSAAASPVAVTRARKRSFASLFFPVRQP